MAGGLASGGCLPTDDLTDYSEQWSGASAGSGGAGIESPAENDGAREAGASTTGMDGSDGGPMLVDMAQGGLGGTSSAPSGGSDAGLDAGVTDIADADAAALPDACADAAPGSLGCGS